MKTQAFRIKALDATKGWSIIISAPFAKQKTQNMNIEQYKIKIKQNKTKSIPKAENSSYMVLQNPIVI